MLNYIDGSDSSLQKEKYNNKFPGPVASGCLFSLTTILLTYGGSLLVFDNSYLRSGLGELLFVLLPVLILLAAGRYNIKDTLKLNKVKPVNYVIIVFLMLFGMPVVGALNAIVIGLIRLVFGKNLAIPQIEIPDVPTLLLAILVIGVSAAVCEEVLFRGLISKGYERYGIIAQILFTSLLFGILHRDLQKTVSTVLLGALIGFIVYRTNSIYAGMAAHFTNNTAAVLLTFSVEKMTENLNKAGIQSDISGLLNMPLASLIVVIVFYALMFLGFLSAFIALFFALCKNTKKSSLHLNEPAEMTGNTDSERKLALPAVISALPGIILILLIFAGQFLQLMNVSSGPVYNILRMLALA